MTRLILPAAFLAAALLVANQIVPKPVAAAILIALDITILALCFGLIRSLQASRAGAALLEERIAPVLERYFPPWFARLVSTDVTVVTKAMRGLASFIAPPSPTAYTYVNGSKIVFAAMIVGISVVPDGFFFWLLIPHKVWGLALILDVLDVWAFLWLFGLYGTMVKRPHVIGPDEVLLRNGIFQSVRLSTRSIIDVHILGHVKTHRLGRRRNDHSAALTFGGVPLLRIDLDQPGQDTHLFRPTPRDVLRVFVASDQPEALRSELLAASTASRLARRNTDPVAHRLSRGALTAA